MLVLRLRAMMNGDTHYWGYRKFEQDAPAVDLTARAS
jgi:fatty-acid desaturase